MGLIVKKFGGTSVGDVERIRNVARTVKDHVDTTGDQVIVVASAMAGETTRLSELANSCVKSPDPRELDVILSSGEQVSIGLLSMALNDLGISARSLSAFQARIETDTRHNRAQILGIDAKLIQGLLDAGKIPVVAGFQGIDSGGDITTLGRGGSDITAVAVAAALKADACWIYTDVSGVYSSDPRICRNARLLPQVCHEEMLEMASLGAKVLHPRAVYFAMAYDVPLRVLSTFEEGAGTWIVREEELMEKPVVTGITHRSDEAKITMSKLPAKSSSLSTLFQALASEDIFVDMITQTGFDGASTDVSFTVPDEDSERALETVRRQIPLLEAEGAELNRDIAKVSVVGIGMKFHTGVAATMFSALSSENIPVQMISTSEIKVSVIIPRKYCEVAVRTLDEAFHEYRPVTSVES